MTFSEALESAKQGYRIARKGWNGKGMWVLVTLGRTLESVKPDSFYDKCGFKVGTRISDHLDMKAADGTMIVGWSPSQLDLFANDWYLVVGD